jgi:hypothetical protein
VGLSFLFQPPRPLRWTDKSDDADHVVDLLFDSLHTAWKDGDEDFERQTWARLIQRLTDLPPPRRW